ncbi:hypothetical protein N656DRAFT_504723 [Canariomyces notabilis]|uniref:Uncharacterized protein n=1 Tax=Canariomyces notabilis TaxID=2074819 RepID=A0AAN6T856_9PEZI|nr:hypothetical protein N656DRAFT_504723 [Canariomyces arenarius]
MVQTVLSICSLPTVRALVSVFLLTYFPLLLLSGGNAASNYSRITGPVPFLALKNLTWYRLDILSQKGISLEISEDRSI